MFDLPEWQTKIINALLWAFGYRNHAFLLIDWDEDEDDDLCYCDMEADEGHPICPICERCTEETGEDHHHENVYLIREQRNPLRTDLLSGDE